MFRPIHPAELVSGHVADRSLPEKGEIDPQSLWLFGVCDDPRLGGWRTFSSSYVVWQKWTNRTRARWFTVS